MDPILIGKAITTPPGERVVLRPEYANRHGLVAGATGTGKTVTLIALALALLALVAGVLMQRRQVGGAAETSRA